MRKFLLPVVLSLFAAGLAQADQVTFSATCDPTSPTVCATPTNLIGGPVSLTVSLGADTLVFTSPAATQVVQTGIVSFESLFGNGGGSVELFGAHNHLLADGTFLPGATSTSDQGGVFSTFDANITFSFLKPKKLGLSPKDKTATGTFSYSFDATLGPFGNTSSYTLAINGSPARIHSTSGDINGFAANTAVPEPATFLLLVAALGAALLTRFLTQPR